MSELKYQLMLNKDMSWVPCYIKSEADKVIAELKAENERLKATPEQIMKEVFDKCLIYPKEMVRLDDAYKLAVSLRKQKYKRCLAMASKCRLRARWFGDNAFYKKEQWALQWHKRWLKLADKFKPET